MKNIRHDKIILAVPKGRILGELIPLLKKANIVLEKSFFDNNNRKLLFSSNLSWLQVIRVRSFDAATFVAYGGADIGVVGYDVLKEFDYPEIYAPIDLKIGKCHLSLASPKSYRNGDNSFIKIATKYPNITKGFYSLRGKNVNCIKMNGAMEIAPKLGLSDKIVDLVSSGMTLKANDLVEEEKILKVTSHLIINRSAFKTRFKKIRFIMSLLQGVIDD
tara:strand:+ start:4762 stop:5415 length:654 start_codon:yes stop_codon:yes gene_type:complete